LVQRAHGRAPLRRRGRPARGRWNLACALADRRRPKNAGPIACRMCARRWHRSSEAAALAPAWLRLRRANGLTRRAGA